MVLAQVADADVGGASSCKKECMCRLIDEAKENQRDETFMRGASSCKKGVHVQARVRGCVG